MSNKKPSQLAPWGKDQSMVVHAHKPGVSQKVSIQDIIDAVPVPEASDPFDISEKGKELVALETVQAMKQMLEVSDIEASEAGKDLIALETVAAMKEMLEVPEAMDGEPALLQSDALDTDTSKALRVGGFGLGATYNTGQVDFSSLGVNANDYRIPTGFYNIRRDSFPNNSWPAGMSASTDHGILHFTTKNSYSGLQIVTSGSNRSLFVRVKSSDFNSYHPWKDILATQASSMNEVGSLRIARVATGRLSNGTKDSSGRYTTMNATYIEPCNFNGDTQTETKNMSGNWEQVTHCDHESEDILARTALWRRIA